jgi:membrane protein DedA with SNARE-associated domain
VIEWGLFLWSLANQAGVPIPVGPSLFAAGAMATTGCDFALVLAAGAGGSLCADAAWYSLGRWRGPQALHVLRRLVGAADHSVPRRSSVGTLATSTSARWGLMLAARFLPELNALAAGLAGATRTKLTRYFIVTTASALIWAATWAGLGHVLGATMLANAADGATLVMLLIGLAFATASITALIIVRILARPGSVLNASGQVSRRWLERLRAGPVLRLGSTMSPPIRRCSQSR